MDTKICTQCNIDKPLDQMVRRKEAKDGYRKLCKSCKGLKEAAYYKVNTDRILTKHRKYNKDNKEKIRVQKKQYHIDNRERILARVKKWSEENVENLKTYHVKWYLTNRERIRENHKIWAANNPDKRASHAAKRRANKRKLTPSNADFKLIEEFYKEACDLTESTGTSHHVDHIKPLSKGGLHHQDNLQVLTAAENLSKGNKY